MAEKEKDKQTKSKTKTNSQPAAKVKAYNKLIDRLHNEREKLQDEITREYKEGRRYVRSHPEEGVLIGLLGGIAIGVILGRLMK